MEEKAVKVEVIRAFVDKEGGSQHFLGDVLEVSRERLKQLNACGAEQNFVPLVRVIPEEPEKKARRK